MKKIYQISTQDYSWDNPKLYDYLKDQILGLTQEPKSCKPPYFALSVTSSDQIPIQCETTRIGDTEFVTGLLVEYNETFMAISNVHRLIMTETYPGYKNFTYDLENSTTVPAEISHQARIVYETVENLLSDPEIQAKLEELINELLYDYHRTMIFPTYKLGPDGHIDYSTERLMSMDDMIQEVINNTTPKESTEHQHENNS